MARTTAICFLIISILWCGPALTQSERDNNPGQAKTATPPTQANPREKTSQHDDNIEPYRLDFSFNELENEKKINTRQYAMNLTAGNNDEIRIGTRVPVHTESSQTGSTTQFHYMDVGTKIWASLRRRGDGIELQVRSEISNLDAAHTDDRNAGWLPPVVRSINISGSTLLVTAKPMLIGSTDDPNSNRQFQLEVTATKLR